MSRLLSFLCPPMFTGQEHVLGLHHTSPRDNSPGVVPLQRSWNPRRLSPHERVRITHLQTSEQGWVTRVLQVSLQGWCST